MTDPTKSRSICRRISNFSKARRSAKPFGSLMNAKAFFRLMFLSLFLIGVPILPSVAKENSGTQKTAPLSNTEAGFGKDAKSADSSTQVSGALEWFKVTVPLVQALIWPAAVVVIVVIFRSHIGNVISSRMQSGKVKALGVELEIQYVKDTNQFEKIVQEKTGEKPKVYGNPDMFELLAKATTSKLMKSTKVMNTPNGCVVQVSTKEIGPTGSISVAEAATFIPGINVIIKKDNDTNVSETTFVNVSEYRASL